MTRIDADAIVRPETTEEISQILALCNSVGQPIVVQGGMSGWVRATQTRPGEIILSLERMNAIERVDTANPTAIVQAGVFLEPFQDHLDQRSEEHKTELQSLMRIHYDLFDLN